MWYCVYLVWFHVLLRMYILYLLLCVYVHNCSYVLLYIYIYIYLNMRACISVNLYALYVCLNRIYMYSCSFLFVCLSFHALTFSYVSPPLASPFLCTPIVLHTWYTPPHTPPHTPICSTMPNTVQTIFLSATFERSLLDVASELVPKPINRITLPQGEICLDNVKQFSVECVDKYQVLSDICAQVQFDKMIVFVEKRTTANELASRKSTC